jgi:hypothetical protein
MMARCTFMDLARYWHTSGSDAIVKSGGSFGTTRTKTRPQTSLGRGITRAFSGCWKKSHVFNLDEALRNSVGKERKSTEGRFSSGEKATTYTAHAKGALPRARSSWWLPHGHCRRALRRLWGANLWLPGTWDCHSSGFEINRVRQSWWTLESFAEGPRPSLRQGIRGVEALHCQPPYIPPYLDVRLSGDR